MNEKPTSYFESMNMVILLFPIFFCGKDALEIMCNNNNHKFMYLMFENFLILNTFERRT